MCITLFFVDFDKLILKSRKVFKHNKVMVILLDGLFVDLLNDFVAVFDALIEPHAVTKILTKLCFSTL